MFDIVIANGLKISFSLVSDSENRNRISENEEVKLVQ